MVEVGVIGLGAAAREIILPALASLAGVELTGGCDPDPQARAEARRRWRLPRLYATADELLASRPDVVVIATPPASHHDLALAALAAGCHIFCEKPFVATVAEADAVIASATRAGRQVAVNNQYRQMGIYRAARAAITTHAGLPYLIEVMQRLYQPPEREGGWRGALRERVVFEFGTHALDLLCYCFDDYPTAVSARAPRLPGGGAADALVVARLDFPGDRVATLSLDRVSRAPARYLDLRLACPNGAIEITLGGAAGVHAGWDQARRRPSLGLDLYRGGEARLAGPGGTRVLARAWRPPFAPATARHFQHFLAAIERGVEPLGSARHARELLRIVAATYQSAALEGERIAL